MTAAAKLTPASDPAAARDQLRLVIVGHVDHGKSTLIGRLLHETDSLQEGKEAQIRAAAEKRGQPFEWSFLLDALQTERDQGLTIDTTEVRLKLENRDVTLIDAPGHREFLKNMITGAAAADAALLLVDASEGLKEQTRRHAYLLHLLGLSQVAVLINKIDRVGYAKETFEQLKSECIAYLESIGVTPRAVIPAAARDGEMIAQPGNNLSWYKGPTVLEMLSAFTPHTARVHLPLRFPVQDVYRTADQRIIVGRIESGSLKTGDTILISPSNQLAEIRSIETWPPNGKTEAHTGEAVGITLTEQRFVERGAVISHDHDAPMLSNMLRGRIFWLVRHPLSRYDRLTLRLGTASYSVEVKEIEKIIDTDNLDAQIANQVERLQVAEIMFQVRGLAALDPHHANPALGRFVLQEGHEIVGGGIIDMEGIADQRTARRQVKSENITHVDFAVSRTERARMNGHWGGVLWFTGLSGSGKSTLATELQKRLFDKGWQVFVLDGDNMRQGLCADLGFSPDDRSENIRRVGEVAALFAKAGMIVISAFISPYREDRRRVRAMAAEYFHTVHLSAGVEVCETRDVKGLYKKARAGKIPEFTGVSAPYETPENPELVLDTGSLSIDESVDRLLEYVEREFGLQSKN